MKFVLSFILLIATRTSSTPNSNIECSPTIKRRSASDIQQELEQLNANPKNKDPKHTESNNPPKTDRILSVIQVRHLILDKDGSQTIIERHLADTTDGPTIEGAYDIVVECIAEGPYFKNTTQLKMRCPMKAQTFTMRYFARKKEEKILAIKFVERMELENVLEAEKLEHVFNSKEIVNLRMDEEKCEILASNAHLTRMIIFMILVKLIIF